MAMLKLNSLLHVTLNVKSPACCRKPCLSSVHLHVRAFLCLHYQKALKSTLTTHTGAGLSQNCSFLNAETVGRSLLFVVTASHWTTRSAARTDTITPLTKTCSAVFLDPRVCVCLSVCVCGRSDRQQRFLLSCPSKVKLTRREQWKSMMGTNALVCPNSQSLLLHWH